jgi:hypothetical protein
VTVLEMLVEERLSPQQGDWRFDEVADDHHSQA